MREKGPYAKSQAALDALEAQGGSKARKELALEGFMERLKRDKMFNAKSAIERGSSPVDSELMERVSELTAPSEKEAIEDATRKIRDAARKKLEKTGVDSARPLSPEEKQDLIDSYRYSTGERVKKSSY
jgi:hypothetical protein